METIFIYEIRQIKKNIPIYSTNPDVVETYTNGDYTIKCRKYNIGVAY